MKVNVVIPSVGESVTEAVISQWMVKSGDYVKKNQVLLSLETDKASVEVISEYDGIIEIKNKEGETVTIGATVAQIDTSVAKPAEGASHYQKSGASVSSSPSVTSLPSSEAMLSSNVTTAKEIAPELKGHLPPSVKKIVTEHNLDPSTITGTGRDGRITKGDALNALKHQVVQSVTTTTVTPTSGSSDARTTDVSARQTRTPMTSIRKRIAERLLMSQQTTATLTTFNEIDMSRVMEIRAKYKDRFKEKYNVNLGFMGFFAKASIEALKAWPAVNAFLEGNEIVYNHYVNLGIAVGTDKGLVVPVIKDADKMSIAEIEIAIRDYAMKAREGKISVADLSGGTFTISNGGVYGSLLSTPILNPPQTGILGLHKIEERPVALNGQVVIRPMMYVALSYDHRMIDGKEAVSFLVKIKEGIEDPERLLLEV
jgi:2-oxoglutarate dehydrogenase E2 component (dihydrolipoamide succinyltransferase)